MLQTRTLPQSSNKKKEEFTQNFEKLDKNFSILQNIQPSLKVTDGNNSQLDSVVLKKRDGTSTVRSTSLSKITSQFYFKDRNGVSKHILTDGKSFEDTEGNIISQPVVLTGAEAINNIIVNSYIGDPEFSGKNFGSIKGTWTTVEYDYNSDLTKLTYSSGNWDDQQLINRMVVLNTANESIVYNIEENGEDWIKVRGDMKGIITTTTADITTTSTAIEVNSTQGFPTGGGQVQIGDSNDEIYYTVIEGAKFEAVSGISINYASGTKVRSGVTRAAVGDPFEIKHTAVTDKIIDTSKNFKSGGGGELIGKTLKISHGTGKGQIRKIIGNDQDTITVSLAFNPLPDSSSTYDIYKENGQVMYLTNGENKAGRFDGTIFSESEIPSGKYLEQFDGRVFVGNTNYVVPDEVSLKIKEFTSLGATEIPVDNVDSIPTEGIVEISKEDGSIYNATYDTINTVDNKLTDVSGLTTNLEKNDIIKMISRKREGTATGGSLGSLSDTNKKWEDDNLKDMYLVIVGGTGAGQKIKILTNNESVITTDGDLEVALDNTSEYQIHTENRFTVYYSNPNDFEDFNILTRFITPPGNDEITGLKAWNDRLFIFKKNSIWSVIFTYNSTLGQWTPKVEKVPTDTGCANGRSIVQVEDALWFFDGREYKSVGYSDTQIGVIKTDSVSFQINKLFKSLDVTQESDIAAVYADKKFYFAPKGLYQDSSGYNTVFIYDYEYNTWITYTGLDINSIIEDDNFNIYFGGRNSGSLYTMDKNSNNDSGSPIDAIVETKAIDLGNDHLYKRFRHAAFAFENSICTMDLKMIINSASELKIVEDVSELGTPAFGGLGTETFGEATLAEGLDISLNQNLIATIKKTINKKGITLKLRVSNDKDENFSLSGMSFTYSVMKERYFPNRFIR